MAEEYHPELTHVGFSELGRFIRAVDRKIVDLLEDFRAEGNEMIWAIEALKNNQESMKRRLQGVIRIIFEKNNEDELIVAGRESEESVALVEALVRLFWRKEEQIDGRMNKCCEFFSEGRHQKAKEEIKLATNLDQSKDPPKIEGEQEMHSIELKSSSKESRAEVTTMKGPSMAETNLEAALSRTCESFSQLTCFARSVDRSIKSLVRNFKENGSEMDWAVENITDLQESLKARLNELREDYFETVNDDKNLEVVTSSKKASMLRSLMKEEQEIDFCADRFLASPQVNDTTVPKTGRLEQKMSCVTVETKLGSEEDELSASDISLHGSPDLGESVDRRCAELPNLNITEEDCKAIDERRNAQIEMDNILKSLQKKIAEDLKCRAAKIQVEVSLMVVELFLLLSTSRKGYEFQPFKSCLKDIDGEKRDTKVVKSILKVLNLADKKFSKLKMGSPQEETDQSFDTDDDKQLQEVDKQVQELLCRFIILIARLEAHISYIGHFESQVLADEAIEGFEKGMKDMEREVQDMESSMEVLRSRFSYGDSCPILVGIANDHCGLSLQKA